MYLSWGCKQQPLAAGSCFAFWLKLKTLRFVTTVCWFFILFFNSLQLSSQFTSKRLQHMVSSTLHIIESLVTGSHSASNVDRKWTETPLLHPSSDITCMSKLLVGLRQQSNCGLKWQAKHHFPFATTSYIAPPVEKCNHVFRQGGSSACEKRVYRIRTHCHYAAHVVPPQYRRPLISNQCGLKSIKAKKDTLVVMLRVL